MENDTSGVGSSHGRSWLRNGSTVASASATAASATAAASVSLFHSWETKSNVGRLTDIAFLSWRCFIDRLDLCLSDSWEAKSDVGRFADITFLSWRCFITMVGDSLISPSFMEVFHWRPKTMIRASPAVASLRPRANDRSLTESKAKSNVQSLADSGFLVFHGAVSLEDKSNDQHLADSEAKSNDRSLSDCVFLVFHGEAKSNDRSLADSGFLVLHGAVSLVAYYAHYKLILNSQPISIAATTARSDLHALERSGGITLSMWPNMYKNFERLKLICIVDSCKVQMLIKQSGHTACAWIVRILTRKASAKTQSAVTGKTNRTAKSSLASHKCYPAAPIPKCSRRRREESLPPSFFSSCKEPDFSAAAPLVQHRRPAIPALYW
ncbi:hypothetical protein KSP40_PGU018295 [Platanthera guangdongensis]|uniref:Uncharacterized protein n=1 Tax=Platanthera guangdongensis TaxID=2320717 RepID=A0ABR2LL16_9ASPA